ncbi:MAG: hypothetical protein PHU94_03860 [Bacilli bacterium]|nr:hypothetical protein [Bacilli bacterium]
MEKQKWDFKKVALKNLILWDNNPRTFDKNYPNPDEKEIISRYQADKILRIAKNILKYQNGNLQPGELTVVKKGKNFVIFDGNRRISAYKILLNPELATDKKDRFIEVSQKVSFTDKKELWVNIAPDIKSALTRIDDIHNNNFHENWNPTAKTNFALLNIDGQIKELKEKKTHLKRDSLYKKIKSFVYNEEVLKIINDPNEFKITSLERIVDSSVGKEYLNYDFDEKGEIVIGGDDKVFNQVLKKIAEDVALRKADSRKQHTNEQKLKYFKELFKNMGLSKSGQDKEIIPKTKRGTVRSYPKWTRKKILPQLKKIIDECYYLDSQSFANARTSFARVTFEAVLKYVIDETLWKNKKLKNYNYFQSAFFIKKRNKYTNFTRLKTLFMDLILEAGIKKAFNDFDLEKLHQSIHNYRIGIGPNESISTTNNLIPLIEFMLQDEADLLSLIDTSKLV